MSIFPFRDSWEVWRQKVNEALGSTEPIPASNITFDNSGTEVTATTVQGAIAEVAGDVASVAGVVGDEDSGLVKDVADLQDEVEGISDNINQLGAKNILPLTVKNIDSALKTTASGSSGLDANNEITVSGVTLSVLTDDANNVTGVKLNGTATADIYFRLYLVRQINCFGVNNMNTYDHLNNDDYAISGANSDADLAIYYQAVISSTDSGVFIKVNDGKAIDNTVLYPMIRLKSVADDTFAPYAMSNRELTEKVEALDLSSNVMGSNAVTPETDWNTANVIIKRKGKIVHITGFATCSTDIPTGVNTICTINDETMFPTNTERFMVGCGSDAWLAYNPCYLVVNDTDGAIRVQVPSGTAADTVIFGITYISK